MGEEKVYWKDISLMIYYFIFGTLVFITAIYDFDIIQAGLFGFGIFVSSMFIKYNMNFNIKNIRKVWKEDKRKFKIRKLSHRDLRKDYISNLYYSILMLFFLNILIFSLFVSYSEINYVWFLYFLFLIYSIYSYKRMKKGIYLNENEYKRKNT